MARKLTLLVLASSVAAFPAMMDSVSPDTSAKMTTVLKRQINTQDPLGVSQSQTNCGFAGPCTTFSESQLVSTTGNNAYASPGPGDIRGPCPGLYVLPVSFPFPLLRKSCPNHSVNEKLTPKITGMLLLTMDIFHATESPTLPKVSDLITYYYLVTNN